MKHFKFIVIILLSIILNSCNKETDDLTITLQVSAFEPGTHIILCETVNQSLSINVVFDDNNHANDIYTTVVKVVIPISLREQIVFKFNTIDSFAIKSVVLNNDYYINYKLVYMVNSETGLADKAILTF